MKECFKCGRNLRLDEFYAHPGMRDGHLNKCKSCTKADSLKRTRSEKGRAYDRGRYRNSEKRREACRAQVRAWIRKNPEKRAAQIAVNNAVRDGKLHRPDRCEDCGKSTQLEAHHNDYSRALDVEWLCSLCHGKRHRTATETSNSVVW